MTRDAKETIELMKGPIPRARAKKMNGALNVFMEGTFKDIHWHKIAGFEDGIEASKLFPVSVVHKRDQNCTMEGAGSTE